MIKNNKLIAALNRSVAVSNTTEVAVAKAAAESTKDVAEVVARTYYVEVRDHSGSMKNKRQQVIEASNRQVQVLAEEGGGEGHIVTATVVNFGSKVHKPTLLNAPVTELQPLSADTFNPDREWTALYDAVGSTIDLVKKFPAIDDPNTSVYFVIISDGEENRSTKYSAATVAAKIKSLKETERWNFVYIGTNQDLDAVGDVFGIEKGNMLQFADTMGGMKSAGVANTRALKGYLGKRRESAVASAAYSNSVMLDVAPANEQGIADASLLEDNRGK